MIERTRALKMENFKKSNLEIHTKQEVEVVMTWWGKSDDRDPSVSLEPYFENWLRNVETGKNIIIDFQNLEFMNSSTVMPIINLVKKLSSQAEQNIRVVYDKKREWQRASFTALRSLFSFHPNITVEGAE